VDDVAKKYRTKPRNGSWYEIEVITTRRLDGQPIEWLRVTMQPGRYYQGDYRTPAEMSNAIPLLDLADLEEVADN
jgi:hypothetical protein